MSIIKELVFRIVGAAFTPFRKGGIKVKLYSGGMILALRTLPNKIDFATIGRLLLNTYERHERKLLRDYFMGSELVIELGSSLGVVTSEIAAKCPFSRIVSVEASEELSNLLSINLRLANYGSRVTIRKSVYAGSSYPSLKFNLADTLSSSLLGEDGSIVPPFTKKEPNRAKAPSQTHVETVSLNRLLLEHNSPSVYSLVSDIEGAEVFLFDEWDALKRCKEVLIELHDNTLLGYLLTISQLTLRFENLGFVLIAKSQRAHYFRNRAFMEQAE